MVLIDNSCQFPQQAGPVSIYQVFIIKTVAATSPQFARNSEVIPLTEAQKLGIVRAHNIYRNAVVPKAANMNALLWSEQLSFRN